MNRAPGCRDLYCIKHSRCWDWAILVLAVLAAVVLVVAGILIVSVYVQSSKYIETDCLFAGKDFVGMRECRKCQTKHDGTKQDSDCYTSLFPCLKVKVNYTDAEGHRQVAQVYSDVSRINKGKFLECSYYHCYRYEHQNNYTIKSLISEWKYIPWQDCFYNPAKKGEVIEERSFSLAVVLAAMLIPGVVLLVCAAVLLYRCLSCCRQRHQSPDQPQSKSQQQGSQSKSQQPASQHSDKSQGFINVSFTNTPDTPDTTAGAPDLKL